MRRDRDASGAREHHGAVALPAELGQHLPERREARGRYQRRRASGRKPVLEVLDVAKTVRRTVRARKGARSNTQELPKGGTAPFPIVGTADVPVVVVATAASSARPRPTVPAFARMIRAHMESDVSAAILWSQWCAMLGGAELAADALGALVRACPPEASAVLGWSRTSSAPRGPTSRAGRGSKASTSKSSKRGR